MPNAKAILNQLSDADLRLLNVFKVVADANGFSSAEATLNINCSTISKHIKDLETRLGLVLCLRGRSGFQLTQEGLSIYQAINELSGAIDNFKLTVNELHDDLSGVLRIGIFDKTISNPEAHITEAFSLFGDKAPHVHLELYVEPLNAIETGVLNGRFHVGIVPSIKEVTGLDYARLFDEEMSLYCGANGRLATHINARSSFVRTLPYAGLGYYSPNMAFSQKLGLKSAATAFDQEAVATLILSGHYVGFLPDHYAESFVNAGKLLRFINNDLSYQCAFKAVVKKNIQHARAATMLLQLLKMAHR